MQQNQPGERNSNRIEKVISEATPLWELPIITCSSRSAEELMLLFGASERYGMGVKSEKRAPTGCRWRIILLRMVELCIGGTRRLGAL